MTEQAECERVPDWMVQQRTGLRRIERQAGSATICAD